MTPQEELFWTRFLGLAKERLLDQKNQQLAYDYFVNDACLLGITNSQASIYLDSDQKQIYWEKNLADLLLTAGFEIYGEEIFIHYQFQLEPEEKTLADPISKPLSSPLPSLSLDEIRKKAGLKEKYTFDSFVQGDGNMWAKAAALAVSENLGGIYNPLFIYGGPGLGKTPLLNAIGNEVLEQDSHSKIKYIPAETFVNDFIERIRLDDMESFKKEYRSLDLLLIDDIQSLSKKVSTQEEFFNTFNALHGNQSQIVLTSDRSPGQLENLEERLVSRFKWGLTSDITPPDFETRIAILRNKIAEFSDFHFPDKTIEYLAGQFDTNVRELEGALKDISLLAKMKQVEEVSVELAAEAIRARKQDATQVKVIPIEHIQAEVGNFYGVSVKEMKGTRRLQNIVLARQVAMYLAREMTDNSLPKIGREFGGKDHTTVIHAHSKIKSMLAIDDNLAREVEAIRGKIR